jgi:hypothetical protein
MLPFVVLPNVRLIVGLVVSLFCLIVVFFARPLVDASLDVLMIVSLITQTLTLQCMCPTLMYCLVIFRLRKIILLCLFAASLIVRVLSARWPFCGAQGIYRRGCFFKGQGGYDSLGMAHIHPQHCHLCHSHHVLNGSRCILIHRRMEDSWQLFV